ncbi:MAG: hemerythrin domain-containing protein [Acidobacteria bacterium]|nr:hemerythrin domain-containing protein [Acidobacteriota bacterium]
MSMLLTEILTNQQEAISGLFDRLGQADARSEAGRRTLILLRARLEEHLRLEDTLLVPALQSLEVNDPDARGALTDFRSGYHRLGEMLEAFWQRWDPDGPLPSEWRMEADFLFNLVRYRLKLTRRYFYGVYEASLAAA